MQVLNTGTTYRIYDESMKAFNSLPSAVYKVSFSPMMGYSLIKSDPIEINEKIYGIHLSKVEKVYNSFKIFPRNLGVILSGNKGIGKSLFAKLLSIKAIENGYPIIMVDRPYPGIADFLGSIQQEVVVLFDEFDKTFGIVDGKDPQAEMLTLFDGLYMGKKLFIITCNEIRRLNDFLINRPGRFHYHFRFNYPNDAEITEYLQDNVVKEYWNEIPNVVAFSKRVDLNYDCLRAIAFELNIGSTFAEAAADLNIVKLEKEEYNLVLYFKNGISFKYNRACFDLFGTEDAEESRWLEDNHGDMIYVTFDTSKVVFDYNKGGMIANAENIRIETDESNDDAAYKAKIEELKKIGVDYMTITKVNRNNNLHYVI